MEFPSHTPSRIKLKVAVGQQAIHGDSQGNLKIYVLGTSNTQSHELGAFGGPFNPVFNTVSGLNCRLLSPHDMMCDNFDLQNIDSAKDIGPFPVNGSKADIEE